MGWVAGCELVEWSYIGDDSGCFLVLEVSKEAFEDLKPLELRQYTTSV